MICTAPNQKNESETKSWLTGPVKSTAILSNEGKPEVFYNLEGIPMKASEAICDTGTPFPNINLLLCLRWRWRLKQHSERRLTKGLD